MKQQPVWLDPSDPDPAVPQSVPEFGKRMAVRLAKGEEIPGNAVHSVAANGISPEQPIDKVNCRIKQILSE